MQERSDPHSNLLYHTTTRVGIDGTWVGGNHGPSYVSFVTSPGAHQLCTDLQSAFEKKLAQATELNAASGQIYYYLDEVTIPWEAHPAEIRLKPIDEAEAKILISTAAKSTWQAKN